MSQLSDAIEMDKEGILVQDIIGVSVELYLGLRLSTHIISTGD